jgi:hypothetical protein
MMRMNRIQTNRKHHLPVNYSVDRMVVARFSIPPFYPVEIYSNTVRWCGFDTGLKHNALPHH